MGKRGQVIQGILTAIAAAFFASAAVAEECREDQIVLRGDWGQARFTIEVADDNEERARGLMHRETMPVSAGMLFVYDGPKVVRFWMRNTLIPLDMIFADKTGIVRHVQHEAQPQSEKLIYGGNNIQYVLEINGGLARRLGIAKGSEMQHPALDPDLAAWPCAAR